MQPSTVALFLQKGMASKQIEKSAYKRLFKYADLCYSVNEANRMFCGHISRSASAGANERNIPANDSFNIGWRHITKKELSANMDSDSEICLIGVFIVGFLNDNG